MFQKATNTGTIEAQKSELTGMRTMCAAVAYVIVASLFVLAMSAPSFAQTDKPSTPNPQQAVEMLLTKFQDIYNKKDAAGLATLYMDDAILVPPGPISTGKQSVEQAWQATLDTGRTGLKFNIQQIRAEGDLVLSVGRFTVMSPDEKGTPRERQGNFAHVYQWQGKELKFRVHAFNFLPSPAPR